MIAGFHDNRHRHRSFRPSTVEGVEYQVSSQENLLVSPTLHHLVEEDSSHGRDIIWLLGDRVEQGDSLDISWVLTITHSLVVSKQVIFFTIIPSCLKLVMAKLFMLRLYSFSLLEMKNVTMVSWAEATIMLGKSTGMLEVM